MGTGRNEGQFGEPGIIAIHRAGGPGHMFDAMIVLVACDKTIPGGAMGSSDGYPGLSLVWRVHRARKFKGRDVTIQML